MRLIIRTALGLLLFAGGLTFLGYGIAQAVENGSCGTSSSGRSVGPPCPSGFGPMILLMVLGAFVAFGGAALFASGRRGIPGLAVLGGMLRFFVVTAIVVVGALVLGIVDLHSDDTRPGNEIIVLVTASVLLVSLPTLLRSRAEPAQRVAPAAVAASWPGPAPASSPPVAAAAPRMHTTKDAEAVAQRLRDLQQLKDSGLLGEDEYDERRKQILADL